MIQILKKVHANFENNYPWDCRGSIFSRRRDDFSRRDLENFERLFYLRFRFPSFRKTTIENTLEWSHSIQLAI